MRIPRGLTLIELMTALAVLGVLATLGWRALDGLLRTRAAVHAQSTEQLGWQSVLAQWQADLDQMVTLDATTGGTTPATWSSDAGTVRIVRRSAGQDDASPGWTVVAWAAVDDGHRWARWVSPPVTSLTALRAAWSEAPQRVRVEGVRTVAVAAARVYVWGEGGWTEAARASTEPPSAPKAVRLELVPGPDSRWHGPLTLDWLAPSVAGGKTP
ncbi:MAG: type II secretion system protein J [Tepidimonas ignava]|uniref:PulJ/GspJ family protein n=1 Tax=Tepidimonas ignava TaxID=114249 RepID=UPI00391A8A7D